MTGSRFTVTQWFSLVVGALLAVAALGLVAGVLSLLSLTERRERLADRIDPANIAVLRLSNALLDQETGLRGFILADGDDAFLRPYRQGIRDAADAQAVLEAVGGFALLDRARDDAARTRLLAEAWRREYADRVIAAFRAGDPPPTAGTGKARFDALRAGITATQADLRAARERARRDLDRSADLVLVIFVVVGVLILVAVLAAALVLRGAVIAPLSRLAGDVRRVAEGDFDQPVASSGPREVAELGTDVEAMRERIVAEVAALRDAERNLIEQAEELQRSNQELEQFAYVASHDLQEPLRKVASFTQMLERRYKGQLDERADRYIAFAVDGAKRMQELINDLLEFSRVGRVTAPHERVDTGELLEQARARLAAVLEEAGAEVEAERAADRGGRRRPAHGRVPEPHLERSEVRRRGPAARPLRRRARGRLLALHLHGRRDRHRGRVRRAHLRHLPAPARPRRLRGHGHRPGHVPQDRRVPRRPDLARPGRRAAAARSSSSRFPQNPPRRTRSMSQPERVEMIDVLLVEDDPGDVLLIEEAFADNKVRNRLHTVADGVDAIAFLRREGEYADAPRPDLVLLDLNLPRKDGREVLEEIKTDEALQQIPVVVLTTSKAEEDVLRSYKLHANAYVTKPVDFDRFIEVVRQIDEFFVTVVKLPSR